MIQEKIVNRNGKYYVTSEDGNKNLGGPYGSREEAQKRLKQVEFFKHKEQLVWEIQDFQYVVEEKEGKVSGLRMFGTALQEGFSRNNRNYTIKNIEENDGEMFNFLVAHRKDYDNPDHNVGEGKYYLNGNKLDFEGKVYNNYHHPDIIEQVQKGLVSVSVQGGYQDMKINDGKIVFEGLRIPILALVNKHARGVPAASIEVAISERLEQEDMEGKMSENEDFVKLLKDKEDKLTEVNVELSKLKEAIHGKDEEMKKIQMIRDEEERAKKKKVVESIISLNKEQKESELIQKTLPELELMEKYEQKIKQIEDNKSGVSEVVDTITPGESDGIVIERGTGFISLSEAARQKYNDDLMKSIYR